MRILYGLAGEGMGHATRAKAILEQLIRRHDVHVLTGSKPYRYLSRAFRSVHRIYGFHIIYQNNSVDNLRLSFFNAIRLPLILYSFIKTLWLCLTLHPRLIVTDYDPFTCYAGLLLNIPVVSVGNQHVLNNTDVSFSRTFAWEAWKNMAVNKLLIPSADRFIVTTFARIKGARPGTYLVPPILRSDIARLVPTHGNHVLVYQTSDSNGRLWRLLASLPHRFIVYGVNRSRTGNLTFKTFSEQEFFHDLASCKAVITNGGYSLISEAVALGKPVLSEPVRKQFEQALNGILLEREGFGRTAKRLDRETVLDFLAHLPDYARRLHATNTTGAAQTVTLIEQTIPQASSAVPRSFARELSRAAAPSPSRSMH